MVVCFVFWLAYMMNAKIVRYYSYVKIFEGLVFFGGGSEFTYVGRVGYTECTFGSSTFVRIQSITTRHITAQNITTHHKIV